MWLSLIFRFNSGNGGCSIGNTFYGQISHDEGEKIRACIATAIREAVADEAKENDRRLNRGMDRSDIPLKINDHISTYNADMNRRIKAVLDKDYGPGPKK